MELNKFASAAEATRDLEQRGYTNAFTMKEGGSHQARTGEKIDPHALTVVEYHRFEGPSSTEGDMAVVYAVEGPDDLRGIIVDAYGTYANAALSETIKEMNIKEGL